MLSLQGRFHLFLMAIKYGIPTKLNGAIQQKKYRENGRPLSADPTNITKIPKEETLHIVTIAAFRNNSFARRHLIRFIFFHHGSPLSNHALTKLFYYEFKNLTLVNAT